MFAPPPLPLLPNERRLARDDTAQAVEDLCNGVYMVSTEDSVQLAAFQVKRERHVNQLNMSSVYRAPHYFQTAKHAKQPSAIERDA